MEDAIQFYALANQTRELDDKFMHSIIQSQSPNTILEVGCGNGEMLDQYSSELAIGVDFNEGMVSLAKEKNRKVYLEDICNSNSSFFKTHKERFEVVCANYVFMEFKLKELDKAFSNISKLLSENGTFIFTLSHPKNRHRLTNLGYSIKFHEPFDYNKTDLGFTVFLEDQNGDHHDVGIRDYHSPIEAYKSLMDRYFRDITIEEIKRHDLSHALLFRGYK